MFEIPISSDAAYFSQEHLLFGQGYLLEFEWVEREQFWNLHLYDAQETPIALGLKLSAGWPVYTDFKTGLRLWLRSKKPGEEPKLLSLQKDFMLIAEMADAAI